MLSIFIGFYLLIAASRFYQWYSEQEIHSQNTEKPKSPLESLNFKEPCIGCKK